MVSLMSELLNALDGRSRGVNAPFACLDLAPNSNPVPGVRLTIAAIAVAKKPRHKSLIDAATCTHRVHCVGSFWESITYLTPTAADIYKGHSAKKQE